MYTTPETFCKLGNFPYFFLLVSKLTNNKYGMYLAKRTDSSLWNLFWCLLQEQRPHLQYLKHYKCYFINTDPSLTEFRHLHTKNHKNIFTDTNYNTWEQEISLEFPSKLLQIPSWVFATCNNNWENRSGTIYVVAQLLSFYNICFVFLRLVNIL